MCEGSVRLWFDGLVQCRVERRRVVVSTSEGGQTVVAIRYPSASGPMSQTTVLLPFRSLYRTPSRHLNLIRLNLTRTMASPCVPAKPCRPPKKSEGENRSRAKGGGRSIRRAAVPAKDSLLLVGNGEQKDGVEDNLLCHQCWLFCIRESRHRVRKGRREKKRKEWTAMRPV